MGKHVAPLRLNAVCLAEEQQVKYQFYRLNALFRPTIYHTQSEHANHHTTDTTLFYDHKLLLSYKK